jgi:hypothetical protein
MVSQAAEQKFTHGMNVAGEKLGEAKEVISR